jgi:hypothetical protein
MAAIYEDPLGQLETWGQELRCKDLQAARAIEDLVDSFRAIREDTSGDVAKAFVQRLVEDHSHLSPDQHKELNMTDYLAEAEKLVDSW